MTSALRALLAVAVLAAGVGSCSRAALAPEPANLPTSPVSFELVPGAQVALPRGATLRFIALVSDSRCPAGVQCIHAGEAMLRLELDATGRTHAFELATAPPRDAATVGVYRIGLLDVSRPPTPQARVSVSLAD